MSISGRKTCPYLEIFIELIQDQAHACHQTGHIGRLSLGIQSSSIECKFSLESFKIGHPLNREIMRLHVSLVEHNNERQLRLVQDTIERIVSKALNTIINRFTCMRTACWT